MKKKLSAYVPWAVLAACYLFAILVYALIGRHNVNADIASEMVLADLLNREGGFLSANWYYSTELRVISPVPVYQLALRIFPGNWHMARTLSLAILLAAFAASAVYMGRGAGCVVPVIYAAAACMLPVSEVHRFLFTGGGFYTMYVTVAFLLIGRVLRMARPRGRGHGLWQITLLSLLCGLTGVRMPMIVGLPLFLAGALDVWDALREADTLRGALSDVRTPVALGAGVGLAAMLAGYVINSRVLSEIYHFESFGGMEMESLNLPRLGDQIQYLMNFFGLSEGIPLLSMGGIVDMMTVCVCVLMGVAVYKLMKRRAELDGGVRLLVYFAVFAVALGMFLNLVTGTTENRYAVGYYMAGTFMMVVLVMLLLYTMRCRMAWLRTAAMLAVVGVFVLQSTAFVRSYMRWEENEHEAAAAWLTENGYTQGFASFWNGNILTELSDGELDMYIYGELSEPELTPWLQETRHLSQAPQGKAFVFVGYLETFMEGVPCMQEDRLVWTSPYGSKVYEYEDAQEVIDLQRTLHNS